jgi:hypothetical protein
MKSLSGVGGWVVDRNNPIWMCKGCNHEWQPRLLYRRLPYDGSREPARKSIHLFPFEQHRILAAGESPEAVAQMSEEPGRVDFARPAVLGQEFFEHPNLMAVIDDGGNRTERSLRDWWTLEPGGTTLTPCPSGAVDSGRRCCRFRTPPWVRGRSRPYVRGRRPQGCRCGLPGRHGRSGIPLWLNPPRGGSSPPFGTIAITKGNSDRRRVPFFRENGPSGGNIPLDFWTF